MNSIGRVLARGLRGGLTVGLGLLLVPLSEGDLLAQQAPPPPDQGYSDYGQQQDIPQQPQPYYGQQAAPQQPQPYYGQQAAPQQPYYPPQQETSPQQAYPQSQQAYPQPQQTSPQQDQPLYPDEAQDYAPQGYGQPPAPPDEAQQNSPQPQYAPQQPLGAQQLQQLVAPIALYPDALLAQVLAASTYPLQITEANEWRQGLGDAPPDQVAAGANMQAWDPSVKALTAFPDVLAQLAQNLPWTTELGNAYYNQPQDVLSTVQTMRQRAMTAGTLENTPQETVTQNQGYVELAPANPQVVYVPSYDPWAVYGAPVAPYPGFSVAAAVGGFAAGVALGAVAPVVFGVGVVMSAFAHMAWGFLGWGLGWGSGALSFHGQGYYPHSLTVRDWGLAHGGPRYFGRFDTARGGFGRGGYYGRGGSYARNGEYGRAAAGYPSAARGYAANRGAEGYRGAYRGGYPRNTQAYNHVPAFNARSEYGRGAASYGAYGRSYGSGAYGRPAVGYGSGAYGRSSYGRSYENGYGRSVQSYNRGETMGRSYGMTSRGGYSSYGGQAYRGSAPAYRASAGSYREPSMGRGGFGGYSGSAGRTSGFFGGRHSSGFGGSHFSSGHSGGGGHFGGGHSGGGHFSSHGGGGHGGGHHR